MIDESSRPLVAEQMANYLKGTIKDKSLRQDIAQAILKRLRPARPR